MFERLINLRRMPRPPVIRELSRWVRAIMPRARIDQAGYSRRIAKEKETFQDCANVHDLPPIFHYWSNKHLRPRLQNCGVESIDGFFSNRLAQAYDASPNDTRRILSIGAGNCELEVALARHLIAQGRGSFRLECMELNARMLERGAKLASDAGVGDKLVPLEADFNSWRPAALYDAVVCNQSLHHVLNLEGLFANIKLCLRQDAPFIVSDIIGRNGHQRWPEALELVREFWSELPRSYRYNRQLRRQEDSFLDWDCSVAGFEGIRAQDILPLLAQEFSFEFFFAFANIIDPFTDRSFGHNFDVAAEWDRAFIDRVHTRDEREMQAGRIKPTHILAVLSTAPVQATICDRHLTPNFCIRRC